MLLADVVQALLSGAHDGLFVSFSGGRDSSVILAAATVAARSVGAPDPVPVSLRFEAAETHESQWQEEVVKHLGLQDWCRVSLDQELDVLGPHATALLRSAGPVFPPNVHFHAPIAEIASGGVLLTGMDGDGLFGTFPGRRLAQLARRHTRPRARDVRTLARRVLPRNLVERLANPGAMPGWLTPGATQQLRDDLRRERASAPRRWDRWVAWYRGQAYLQEAERGMAALAELHGTRIVHPFLDRRFLAHVAAAGGPLGFGDRTETMLALFGDLLPRAVLERSTKARFDPVFWGPAARRFAEQWDGTGLDPEIVDADALRAEWRKPKPHFGSAVPMQTAWLATQQLAS